MIYFITICITPRCNALANDSAWKAICETLTQLDKWNTYCIMTMPDHIHLLTAPLDRELSVATFLKWFKRWFNSAYCKGEVKASQSEQLAWQWQEGAFDRLLRSHESLTGKWEYIRQNPVRAGLVANPDDWPYQLQFDASRG